MKLLIGGSPCTHWSIAQTKNRETEASGIGWELFLNYRIARDKYQPDYFLYENNKSMSPAIRAQITAELGVEPVLINSALVSAQNRQRLYWAGKRNPDGTYRQVPVELPEDRGILLRDILETGFPLREKGYALQTGHGATAEDAIARRQRNAVAEPVAIKPLTEKEMEYMVRETKDGRNHFDFDYFHDATKDKSACVTANTHKGVPYNVLVEPIIVNGTKNGKSRTVDAHIMGHFEGLTAGPVEVLSMYDGMSCGHIALDKLGVEIASYHATEIDKFAIQTTQANFHDVVQLGDAFQVREDGWTYAGLTGGTPEAAE